MFVDCFSHCWHRHCAVWNGNAKVFLSIGTESHRLNRMMRNANWIDAGWDAPQSYRWQLNVLSMPDFPNGRETTTQNACSDQTGDGSIEESVRSSIINRIIISRKVGLIVWVKDRYWFCVAIITDQHRFRDKFQWSRTISFSKSRSRSRSHLPANVKQQQQTRTKIPHCLVQMNHEIPRIRLIDDQRSIVNDLLNDRHQMMHPIRLFGQWWSRHRCFDFATQTTFFQSINTDFEFQMSFVKVSGGARSIAMHSSNGILMNFSTETGCSANFRNDV